RRREGMRLSDLVYDLPADLIAQEPAHERGDSRLLVVRRDTDALEHTRITALPALLRAGDLLVLNDTRVIAARVGGRRRGGGRLELLLCEPLDDGRWLAL